MKWYLCTRTWDKDFFTVWLRSDGGTEAEGEDCRSVAEVLEGVYTGGRYCALVRRSGGHLSLSTSVSTCRKDAAGRDIRDFACLIAETRVDEESLIQYCSQVLAGEDSATIYNAESRFARAIEDLYETRSLASFNNEFRGEKNRVGQCIEGRWEFPRGDKASRLKASEQLSATVANGSPFAIVMASRSASKMIVGLNLTGMPIRIFSEQTQVKAECSDFPRSPFPFNRTGAKIAAVAAVAMIVWAILPGDSEEESKPSQKIAEESQKTQSCTNLSQKAAKSCETNSAACLSDSVMTGKNERKQHNVNTNDTRTIQR